MSALRDAYGNELQVTAMAVADEIAAAADLAKGKLRGRPVAVVRGLGHLVSGDRFCCTGTASGSRQDMFGYGSQEAVLAAALAATGQQHRYRGTRGARARRTDVSAAGRSQA